MKKGRFFEKNAKEDVKAAGKDVKTSRRVMKHAILGVAACIVLSSTCMADGGEGTEIPDFPNSWGWCEEDIWDDYQPPEPQHYIEIEIDKKMDENGKHVNVVVKSDEHLTHDETKMIENIGNLDTSTTETREISDNFWSSLSGIGIGIFFSCLGASYIIQGVRGTKTKNHTKLEYQDDERKFLVDSSSQMEIDSKKEEADTKD